MDSFKFAIAIASIYKWDLRQIDIKVSYFNANLDEIIYVQIPIRDKNFNFGKSGLLQKVSLWTQTSWKIMVFTKSLVISWKLS